MSPVRVSRRRLRIGLVLGLLAVGLLVAVVMHPHRDRLVCNGSAELCDRAYNQVTYLTSHNAMASSARGFLAPEQTDDLRGQLDAGVRGLMLDVHRWTTPEDAAPVLATLDPPTRAAVTPLVRADPSRPGIWLCHEICQVGADPATEQLTVVRQWVERHPSDVVTLILEDDVAAADVRAVITAAGLDPLLATPPAPGRKWPSLRQLIRERHTVLVFTEHADGDNGPVRNLYQLAAETPFEAASAVALSCEPGRGAPTAPLFLVNNWVTTTFPTPDLAETVDNRQFLTARVRRCEAQRGMRATFVAVDFAQSGDPLRVVDALNTRRP